MPFVIPPTWHWIRLKEVFELLSGRDLKPSDYNDTEDGIPYITGASNFENHQVTINRWTPRPQVIIREGDLLITCKGTVGELSVNTFGSAHIARQIMALRNLYSLNISYIMLCLSYYVDTLKAKSKGLIPGITRDDILNILLPLPPEEEQKRIVNSVNNALSAVKSIEDGIN